MNTKKFIAIAVVAAAMTLSQNIFAQSKGDNKNGKQENTEWKAKMQAEKIAFITTDLQLTPEEAQVFWPVYNKVDAKRDEALKASHDAFKALAEATKDGKDCASALDAYTKAAEQVESLKAEAVKEFKKVLPIEKVAKLVLSEERFRREQFGRLQKGPQGGQPGGCPQGGFQGGFPGGPQGCPQGGQQGGCPQGKGHGRPFDGPKDDWTPGNFPPAMPQQKSAE